MPFLTDEDAVRELLLRVRRIAVVGLSPKAHRDSYRVAHYMQEHGYETVPVYPRGDVILGGRVYVRVQDIPGIAGADANAGPPLHRVGTRTYIAGYIQNSPDNMAAWIEDPQKALPGNAMPRMGIPQKDARDIAAFLYTLK